MPRYEMVEEGARQFWDIRVEGKSLVTTHGRVGTAGQSTTTPHDSAAKAKKAHDALVAEQVKKGWSLVDTVGTTGRDEDDIDTVVTSALVRPASGAAPAKPKAEKAPKAEKPAKPKARAKKG